MSFIPKRDDKKLFEAILNAASSKKASPAPAEGEMAIVEDDGMVAAEPVAAAPEGDLVSTDAGQLANHATQWEIAADQMSQFKKMIG